MSKFYQWFGYWALNQCPKTQELFNLISAHESHNYQFQSAHENQPNELEKSRSISFKIAYFGETFISTEAHKFKIISFAASGIKNTSDAWIKLDGNHLILGRDSLGRVPIYWTEINQVIWFTSHCQLLLPLLSSRTVNLTAFYNYTCFSYVPTPLTPIEGIFSINAGEEIIFSWLNNQVNHNKNITHQWQSFPKIVNHEKDAITQLQTLLKQSVENQLEAMTDETVGICLSGGLDSSIIAALLVKLGVKVRAYTLEFEKDNLSEFYYAEYVANYLNIPLDLLYKTASQETQVIFNGENGDQLFAGWTNKPMIAANIYQLQHPEHQKDFREKYLQTFHRLYGYERRVFTSETYQKLSLNQPKDALKYALDEQFSTCLLDRLRRATLMLKGAQNIQPRATYLGNDNSLWVRSPFLVKHR